MEYYRKLTLVGAVLLIVGSLLPWMIVNTMFGRISVRGTASAGLYTIVLGGILSLVGLFRRGKPTKRFSIFGFVLALLALLVSGFNLVSGLRFTPDLAQGVLTARVGIGIYMVLIGSVIAAVAALVRVPKMKSSTADVNSVSEEVFSEGNDSRS